MKVTCNAEARKRPVNLTLQRFKAGDLAIPASTAWCLSDLGEFRGKQELCTRQSPQRLKVLREHAMIESAVSSNRIEGVSVEPTRIKAVLAAPRPLFRDRDEEEIRGYRDALAWLHQDGLGLPVSDDTIKRLHAMTRGQIWDAGLYMEKDGDIIERYADGGERVRFRTVQAVKTPAAMAQLETNWQACIAERVGEVKAPRGAKRDLIIAGMDRLAARSAGRTVASGFTIRELEQVCPGVSRDMVRTVLREQQKLGGVECQGRGPAATWKKRG